MIYNAPPQPNTNATNMQYSNVQQVRPSEDFKARWAMKAVFPSGSVMDMSTDSNGCPRKAHVRDANGHTKTVTFDGNQNVVQAQDGYN